MSTRKAKKKTEAPSKRNGVVKLSGPIKNEDGLYFSKEDLSVYELAQYKLANTLQGIRLKKNEAERLRQKVEGELGQMQVQIMQLTKMAEKQKLSLKSIQDELTEQYKVDFSQITYDDETGRIMLPPDEPKKEPASDRAQS